MTEQLLLFFLFITKHFIIDFILQTERQVQTKGIWGHPVGFSHSFEHGIWSAAILVFFMKTELAIFLAFSEIFIHYITDFCKMSFGEKDCQKKQFWINLGLDQYVHYLTYLYLIFIAINA